jgi:hypothetical protein
VAKPFSIQSPEDIAKEYAGNKQRIAQAMQLGVVDPTAGVLAGMFIDRMRSAQMQEQAPQATVAQQVMGGAPATPPSPPSGGLGAAPPAAPPMTPPMNMTPPMPQEAPMGMADGGLATLPVPDAMFDEPTNGGFDDGYAGGGLVAFAGGGDTGGWGDYIEQMARSVFPNLEVAGRGRTAARNVEVGGVADSYHLIDAARDLRTPPGMSKAEFIAKLKNQFGPEYDIIPSKGSSVHVEPGPTLGREVRAGTAQPRQPLKERDVESPEGRRATFEDQYQIAQKRFGELPEAGLGELEAYYRGELAPEKQEKARKDDMWMALAQLGASMASSRSPYFLQAAGEAIAATMPGVSASKKERKAAERDARTGLREVLGLKRAEQKEVLEYAKDLHAIEVGAETSEIERRTRRDEAAIARQHDKDMERIRQQNALELTEARGRIDNTKFQQLVSTFRQQIKERLAQNVPVKAPDGTVLSAGDRPLSESEVNALAANWALYTENRYRSSATSGADPLNLKGGAGATGGGAVDVNYGAM